MTDIKKPLVVNEESQISKDDIVATLKSNDNTFIKNAHEYLPFSDVNNIASALLHTKANIERLKQELDQENEVYEKLSNDFMDRLELSGIESLKINGHTFYTNTKESVRTPKTDEDKKLFFDYLKEKGLFDQMISINSQTLNSLYKSMSEEALEKGIVDFRLPGIDEPTIYKQLRIRKA